MFIKHKVVSFFLNVYSILYSVSSVNRQTVRQTRRRNTEGTFAESQSIRR